MRKRYHVINTPSVEHDVQEIFNWYEEQQLGLGDTFIDRLEEFTDSLETFPFKHEIAKGTIRHGQIEQFPYQLYFEVFEENIVILAVVFGGRHPDFWKTRVNRP